MNRGILQHAYEIASVPHASEDEPLMPGAGARTEDCSPREWG